MGINLAPVLTGDRAIYQRKSGAFDVALSRQTGMILSADDFNNKQVAYTVLRVPQRELTLTAREFYQRIYLSVHREFLDGFARRRYEIDGLREVSTRDMLRVARLILGELQNSQLSDAQAVDLTSDRLDILGYKDTKSVIERSADSLTATWRATRAIESVVLEHMDRRAGLID